MSTNIDLENLSLYLQKHRGLEVHRTCVSKLDTFIEQPVELRKEFYNNCMNKASELVNILRKEKQ